MIKTIVGGMPSGEKDFGITSNLKMDRLGKVVAIFGRNGAGKSRLLNYINHFIQQNAMQYRASSEVVKRSKKMANTHQLGEAERQEYYKNKEIVAKLEQYGTKKEVSLIYVNANTRSDPNTKLEMSDTEYATVVEQAVRNPSYNVIRQNVGKILKSLAKNDATAKAKVSVSDKAMIKDASTFLWARINDLIRTVMRTELTYEIDSFLVPSIKLDGRAFNISELSSGEVELLSFCVFLPCQVYYNNNSEYQPEQQIIIIDEPEQFLHPEAQIHVLDGLRRLIGVTGQLFIATHSVPLLSVLHEDEIWYLEKGDNITPPGVETARKIVESLIGEDNVDNLEDIISRHYNYVANKFAFECLESPTTVPHSKGDPQLQQILKAIKGKGKERLNILDVGAGEGRLAQELLQHKVLVEKVWYQAFETDAKHMDALTKVTDELRGQSLVDKEKEREVIDSVDTLGLSGYKEFFDLVFMVNVLHEIPVNQWKKELNAILASLKSNGLILIVEDQAIPKGELPNKNGFVVLNEKELKALFNLNKQPIQYKHPEDKYSDRLLCVEIPKTSMEVDNNTISDALQGCKSRCKKEILQLREAAEKDKPTPRDARKNAFLTQLYANVDMALDNYSINN